MGEGGKALAAPVVLTPTELLVVSATARGPAAAFADALLREVLTELTGTPAPEHVFTRTCGVCGGPHGKPLLQHPDLHTSLSRSGQAVVVAVTGAGPVGVDVELVAATGFDGFEDVALAPGEGVSSLQDRARTWTRKEAVLKARGTGLTVDPRTVDVRRSPLAGRPPAHLLDVPARTGFACSAAVLARHAPQLRHEDRGLTT